MIRRDFLGFTAGAVAARTVLPVAAGAAPVQAAIPPAGDAHPDADLFAACAGAVAVWDEIDAMPGGQEDEVWYELSDRWADAINAVTDCRARTKAGCKAKARILILEMQATAPRPKATRNDGSRGGSPMTCCSERWRDRGRDAGGGGQCALSFAFWRREAGDGAILLLASCARGGSKCPM